jgi:hypothetical protein
MKQKIYLAGGFKGGWHEYVVENLGGDFIYFNLQKYQLDNANKYTS